MTTHLRHTVPTANAPNRPIVPEPRKDHQRTSPAHFPTVQLCGQAFHAITEEQCVQYILDESNAGRGGWVVTANLDHLRRLTYDRAYMALCNHASMVVADGMPLIWASRLQGTPLPERVAGSNLVHSLSAAAAMHGRSIFLLGGDPGTAQRTAKLLPQRYPKLQIAGNYCPPRGFERNHGVVDELRRVLCSAKPHIIYVALGSPKQEQLSARLRDELPHAWWIGVGISFSFLCGEIRRAPMWMQRSGFEWIHRLMQEPHRLSQRYLVQGLPFASRLFSGAGLNRLRRNLRMAEGES